LSASQDHPVRDTKKILPCGIELGSWSSDPAGTTISRPLRVSRGNGQPQHRETTVAKLLAVGRS
jgi:hypothetical protein